ncbi:MAG: hypothetical protein H7328_07845 [Bdellovibrio sp.]|nr:hypothetical protein [Bdellovibrio sp.]
MLATLLGSFIVPPTVAHAEEDLMQILDGKAATSATAFVESEEIQKLRKVVGPKGAEQNIFFQFLAEKKYEKALFQWNTAYNSSAFKTSATGRALEAFLKFKNDLKVTGVEALLAIKNPEVIDKTVIGLWKENINGQNPVWGLAQATWNPYWTKVFGDDAEMAFLLKKNYTTTEVAELSELIKKTAPDSNQRAILEWQLALNLGIRGDNKKAGQVLAHLTKSKNNPIDSDLITMTAGRLLYQGGFLDAALKYYEKVSKKSDYWFQVQEEMAWTHMRKGEPQNAIAITKTLTYPHFKGLVGIESYLLDAFSRLKVCDYTGVLSTMAAIKPQFSEHLVALEKLSVDGHQPAVETLANALLQGSVSVDKLGPVAHSLPMVASKDEALSVLIRTQKALEAEATVAETLFSHSLTFGNLQGQFETLKNQIKSRAEMTKGAFYQRVQELAKTELADAKQVIQRLHIVEVEMIQQVDSSDKLNKKLAKAEPKAGVASTSSKYAMSFANDKEIWFDELSNFKVDTKNGCAKRTE